MIFNSLTFIFFCFVPCIILILLVEKAGGKYKIKIQNLILLIFSILFFAWSGIKYLKVLIGLIVINYILGRLRKYSKHFMIVGVVFNLGVLFYYKYLNLIIATCNEMFSRKIEIGGDILAPLGISFIIFQCISYLMDLFWENAKPCTNFLDFALYLVFFPKLSQGPIVKYKDMESQLKDRKISFENFMKGLERFIVGLSKKVLIADIVGQTSADIFGSLDVGMDAGTAWIGLFCFSISLYMDFSGYSDMAIGMASMMGFQFGENFDFPYLSTSVTEFWRRWHASLGAWFREYLYFPLGGSRKGNVYFNLFVVFLATGIWHGATWIYLLWGMLHGVCVVAERCVMRKEWYKKIPAFFRWAGTFFIVNIGWITFKVRDMKELKVFVEYLCGRGEESSFSAEYYLTARLAALLLLVVIGTVIFSRKKIQEILIRWDKESKIFNFTKYVLLLLCVYLCFITTISEAYTPFLYFQF